MENPDESKQQTEPCKQNKRGPKPMLPDDEKRRRKNEKSKKDRAEKKAKFEKLEKENEELKKELFSRDQQKQRPYESKQQAEASSNNRDRGKRLKENMEELEKEKETLQFEIHSSNKDLPEIDARTDKLGREMSDKPKKVKMAGKGLKSGMQQLQQKFLDSDDQEDCAENSKFNIPMDDEYLNSLDLRNLNDLDLGNLNDLNLGNFDFLDSQSSKTKGEKVNVNGFNVLEESSPRIQKIFSQHPNIASGLQVHNQALKDCFMNTLDEVYKMAMKDKHTPEQIKYMEEGIKDLELAELAGLKIQWLKNLVKVCREVFENGKI